MIGLALIAAALGASVTDADKPAATDCSPAISQSGCLSTGERSLHECAKEVFRWIARGEATWLERRDEATGEIYTLPDHLDGSWNPGRFRGPEGEQRLMDLLGIDIQNRGCTLPLLDLTGCVDFDSGDPCGDRDGDGWWNELEQRTGSDPDNPISTPEHRLFDEQWGLGSCLDKQDNDGDGRRDKADSGCR